MSDNQGHQRKEVAAELRGLEQAYHKWLTSGETPPPMTEAEIRRRASLLAHAARLLDPSA